MCLHYMVLYYKANRLIEKISIFLLQLMCSAEDSNPDSPSACFPLSRRNPLGFSGISQPGKASPGPRAVAPEPQSLPSLALPKKYQRLLLGGGRGGDGREGGGPGCQLLGPGLSGRLKGEEKLRAELGAAALGNECAVGSGACKEQVSAASWGTGPNRLHHSPGRTPTDIS